MHRSLIILLFLLTTFYAYSQNALSMASVDSLTSVAIQHAINHIQVEKTKLIFIKPEGPLIDSSSFRKVSFSSNNEQVKIVLPDYTVRKEHASEFWGLVNDFGQSQRFYQGNIYIVWHTKAPYVYRAYAASDRTIAYFYSESLVSEIIPLTKENLNKIKDTPTAQQLSAYLKTHDLEKSKDSGPSLPPEVRLFSDEERTILSDFVMFHVQVAWLIAEYVIATAK